MDYYRLENLNKYKLNKKLEKVQFNAMETYKLKLATLLNHLNRSLLEVFTNNYLRKSPLRC